MITITPESMTAAQQREIVPWLEAHGVVARRVYRLDLDADAKTMTVHEYEYGKDGQAFVYADELIRRDPYTVDVGLAWLPWMTEHDSGATKLEQGRDILEHMTPDATEKKGRDRA